MLVNIEELSKEEAPFSLFNFVVCFFVTLKNLEITCLRVSPIYPLQYLCASHIDIGKHMMDETWFSDIQEILVEGKKKNIIPDMRRTTLLRRFYNCLAALMTQQLEDICIRSLKAFADFVCDYGVIRSIYKQYSK